MKDNNKKHSFMMNVMIILFSQVAVKILGLVYRMVITNINGFGDQGNGYYNAGFQVYTLLLAISSVGIPNAISKMTSARNALGDYKGAYKIFRSALILFGAIGIICSVLLFLSSSFIAAEIIKMERAKYVLMALSPSIFFVCISSVIRGYFTGMNNMKATSSSQIIEQIFKCFLTVIIVYIMSRIVLFPNDSDLNSAAMAAGANFATSLATIFSFLYLIVFYRKRRKGIKEQVASSSAETLSFPMKKMFISILMISIPISLGSIISAINRIVDTATITRGIEIAFQGGINAYGKFVANPTMAQLNDEAVRLAGILSKSDTLLNLPIAMNIAFATVLVPSISGALAVGDNKTASKHVSYSLLISILLILPCAVGYIVLAEPIYGLIYPNAKYGYDLLQLSSIALIFIALNQTISGSLQGLGKVFAPATGLFIGCIAKLILNIILIRQPNIHIYGAPISSIACQVISFSYGFTILAKNMSVRLGFIKYILKPLSCAIVMGVAAWGIYALVFAITKSNILSLGVSIIFAAIIYFLMVIILKVLDDEEVKMLPMGEKILGKLKRK